MHGRRMQLPEACMAALRSCSAPRRHRDACEGGQCVSTRSVPAGPAAHPHAFENSTRVKHISAMHTRRSRACAAVFHLPHVLTATAEYAAPPRAAASSRSADIVISRPTITARRRRVGVRGQLVGRARPERQDSRRRAPGAAQHARPRAGGQRDNVDRQTRLGKSRTIRPRPRKWGLRVRAGRADGERGREPGVAGERPSGERAAGHQHQHRGHHQLRRSTALAGFLTIVSTRRRHSAAAHLVSHGVQEGPERGRAALRARARLRRARLRPTARVLTLRCRGGKTVIGNQRPQRRRPGAPTLTPSAAPWSAPGSRPGSPSRRPPQTPRCTRAARAASR